MSDHFLDSSVAGYRQRAYRLMIVVGVVFLGLLGRLAHLQLVEGGDLHADSVKNYARTARIPADRGTIFDRNGKVLAVNQPSFDLFVTPAQVKDTDELIDGLREVLDLDALDEIQLRERVEEPRGMARYRPLRVAKDIDRKRVARAEGLRALVDGISIQVRYQRHYPEGEVGAHLVGYLGRPNAREVKEAGYHVKAMLGRAGVERKFEDLLRGKDGEQAFVVNARGAKQRQGWAERAMKDVENRRAPERGMDVVLTVDIELQKLLLESLARYESGAAVVVDTRDGSVLGMVSKPMYDPNEWSGRLSSATKQAIDENPYKPMLDKSVQSFFPGSVYKPMTALAALEEGILDPSEPIESPGSYEFGNRTFHCHKRSGHGKVDLNDAMAASADVYFYMLGERMGIDKMATYARRFGFGERTTLGINGESKGVVPTKAHHDKNTVGGYQYGLALSTAIGQGDVRTSPLQMALAYAAIANGGTIWTPRILREVRTEDGQVVSTTPAKAARTLEADPDHIALIGHSLERAVNDADRATGHMAAIPGGRIAGKTGTAQVRNIVRGRFRQSVKSFRDRDHAWFAAYAPYESPRIAVVVFLEHGGSGGRDAAPVARAIIEGYHQRIEPLFATTAQVDPPRR